MKQHTVWPVPLIILTSSAAAIFLGLVSEGALDYLAAALLAVPVYLVARRIHWKQPKREVH